MELQGSRLRWGGVQAAGRRMAYYGLSHVLALGPSFHSNASTGALTRMVDRGAPCCSPSRRDASPAVAEQLRGQL